MTLTFTDMFCGAGGASLGLTAAGMRLALGANHWPTAIETHSANFPDAEHLCEDVNRLDMRRLPATNVLWASPICTEISPAGGNPASKIPSGQTDILESFGHVPKAAFERTRATFHDVIRATEVHRYSAVIVENVPDVHRKWELFGWWVSGMEMLGYRVQYVSASSAHISSPGNLAAPQWRDRLYLVFTRTGIPLPDVAPRPLAPCPGCGTDVDAVQSWRNPRKPRIGKYRRQYDYRCPNTTCRNQVVEPYVRPAADIIDWTNLGPRIGDRSDPLSANTMRRITAGLAKFGEPAIVRACGTDPAGSTYLRAWPASSEPLGTRVTSRSDGIATGPGMLVPSGGTWNDTATVTAAPMRTRTVRDMEALVVPYYTTGVAKSAGTPLNTVTTLDRFALASIETASVADCRYRMLQPRESLRAQRFPDTYQVAGNKGEQTMQAGNAVSANVAQWLGQRLAAVL